MGPTKRFWLIIPGSALIVLAAALPPVHVQSAHAQEGKTPAGDAAEPAASNFLGMRRCALCHNQAETRDPVVSREFCLMNEDAIFRTEDKHALAYQVLQDPKGLGQRMAKRLGYDVTQSEKCLTCHAGWSLRDSRKRPSMEQLESGVSCEACHGPSQNWDTRHSEPDWRAVSIAEKIKQGMSDVRDPVHRAQLCYSCHIGNSDEGKIVTHDMYAAGHPPLPSIEIETFIAVMPAHSRKLQEKGNFEFRDEFIAKSRSADAAALPIDARPRTKGVLVGGIMALRESLDLFAKQSGPDKGPEFAMFDCQACHHELRLPAWRQTRSSLGKPGRPRLPEWPAVLAAVGIAQVESDPKVLQDKLKELADAMGEMPFGGSSKVQDIIKGNGRPEAGLIGWLDKKAQALASRPFNQAEAIRALDLLYALGSTEVHDFHSARQIAWAIRSIETETRLTYPSFPPRVADQPRRARRDSEENAIKIWGEWRKNDRKGAEAKAAKILEELNKSLPLDLPAGQKASVGENLGPYLESTAGYDPVIFQKLLLEAARQSGRAAK